MTKAMRWSLALQLAGGCSAFAQGQDLSGVEIEAIPVAAGVYMLAGAGGNIGVSAGADGVFLVDDQYAPLTEKIRAAVRGISDEPIRFLLNTHWHGDHTGGNENLGKAGVLIVAHDNVRKRMSADQFLGFFERAVPPSPSAALPVVTFSDTVTLHINGDELHAFHVPPAHTDGDSVVHFRKADVIHTGDLYFNGLYPYIDVRSGGSIDGMIAAVGTVLSLGDDDTRFIPGHGPASGREGLMAFREMLLGVRDAIAPLVAAGNSRADVLAAKPTRAFDEKWGGGFLNADAFAGIVYDGMAAAGAR